MKKSGTRITYSPTDLARFMENEFITWMDRFYLEFPAEVVPDEKAEEMEILIRRGFQHEETVLKGFNEATGGVFQVSQGDDRYQDTIQAMRAGHRVIYQAALQRDVFAGYADFLVRVERPSGLGNHSYEVCDAKLAHSAKPSFVIQLCCYADSLECIQGLRPDHITVLLGNGSQARFRTDDFFFYYLTLKESVFKAAMHIQSRHASRASWPRPKWTMGDGGERVA